MRAATGFTGSRQTTVGTAVRVRRLRAPPVGGRMEVSAEPSVSGTDGRLTFVARAVDCSGELVAMGEIDWAVVVRQRFLARMPGSADR
ncbi:thioesterase family protein [Streptomyces puniciscabiei]